MRSFDILFVFLVLCVVGSPIITEANEASEGIRLLEVPEKYQQDVEEATVMGTLIYLKDTAAWIATDEIIERKIVEKDQRLRGWITELNGESWEVIFVGEIDKTFVGLYSVKVKNGHVERDGFKAYPEGVQLSDQQMGMFKARQLAASSDFRPCTPNYNTVVIPYVDSVEEFKGFIVYLLASTTDPESVQIGGHYRVKVSLSGDKITEVKPFSNSCLVSKKTKRTAALVVSHILSETPEETHVFLSLQHEMPIYVTTIANDLAWSVDGNEIKIMDQGNMSNLQ